MASKTKTAAAVVVAEPKAPRTWVEVRDDATEMMQSRVSRRERAIAEAKGQFERALDTAGTSKEDRRLFNLEYVGSCLGEVVEATAKHNVASAAVDQVAELEGQGWMTQDAMREVARMFTDSALSIDTGGHSSSDFRNAHDLTKFRAMRSEYHEVIQELTYYARKLAEAVQPA